MAAVNLAFAPEDDDEPTHFVNIIDEELREAFRGMSVGKVSEPRHFNGRNMPPGEWLDIFEVAAHANNWTDEKKLEKVGSFLEEDALKWYMHRAARKTEGIGANRRSVVGKLTDADMLRNAANAADKWEAFRKIFKEAFPGVRSDEAKFELMNSRVQAVGEDFSDYLIDKLARINQYNPLMSEAEKLTHVMRGLTPSLYEKLFPLGIRTLDELDKKAKLYSEATLLANRRQAVNALMAFDGKTSESKFANVVNGVYEGNSSGPRRAPNSAGPRGGRGNFRGRGQGRGGYRGRREVGEQRSRTQSPCSQSRSPAGRASNQMHCYECGKRGHVKADCRKARRLCFNCGGPGHFSVQCPQRRRGQPKRVTFREN